MKNKFHIMEVFILLEGEKLWETGVLDILYEFGVWLSPLIKLGSLFGVTELSVWIVRLWLNLYR